MKTSLKSIVVTAILFVMNSNYSQAATKSELPGTESNPEQSKIYNSVSRKYSPEVTLDRVQEIFGHNLETNDTTLKLLLLAIGMDHTTNESPNFGRPIGIPFIVDKGPSYWVSRLIADDHEIEILVNNALLLLFTKEKIPKAKETSLELMQAAADKGYWPANLYVAENNLNKYLAHDFSKPTPSTGKISSDDMKVIAQDTMDRYSQCAEMAFAPCQYRIGFWLANSPDTLKQGLKGLKQAIKTTMNDTRYQGILDGIVVMAAKEIVLKGEEAGIDYVVREEYTKLIQHQLSALSQEVEQAKESQND